VSCRFPPPPDSGLLPPPHPTSNVAPQTTTAAIKRTSRPRLFHHAPVTTSNTTIPSSDISADVTVLIVTVENCGTPLNVNVGDSREHEAYCTVATGAHVNATAPVKLFSGVSVNANVAATPAVTVALAEPAPFTVNTNDPTGCNPVPDSGTASTPASLEMLSEAVREPIAAGVNVTVIVHPWFGASVALEHGDVIVKSLVFTPLIAAVTSLTSALPVFTTVKTSGAGEATATLPNVSALGVAVNTPAAALPVNATVNGREVALVPSENAPLCVPAALGANVTCNAHVAPAANESPTLGHVPAAAL